MALITAAFVDLESGDVDRALQRFARVCDRPVLPRFFMDWYWRLAGQLGLASARLAKGDVLRAEDVAGILVRSATSVSDPAIRALAWDIRAQTALAAQQWDCAKDYVEHAVAALELFETPIAAWKVHATAAEVHRRTGDVEAAEGHRAAAEAAILSLAASLPEGDPLRESLLSAGPVRRILGREPAA
jgi:hypothetical protein